MRTLLSYLVIATLCAWVGATLALQAPKLRPWLRGKEISVLIPEYRFFAPKPVEGDYHLLYRDVFADGTATAWTEVCLLRPRTLGHAFFHPTKRERKALFDAIVQLQDLQPKEPRAIAMTVPYLAVLNYVSSLPRTVRPAHTQFAVMQSYGWLSSKPTATVMVSRTHKV